MRRNKLFITAGTLALAIAGFANAKANSKKIAAAITGYFYTGGTSGAIETIFKGVDTSIAAAWNITLTNTGRTLLVKTGGTVLSKVYAVKSSFPVRLSTTVFLK